ncbi:MAG: DUF5681 domain-containing protein [Gammaproteobacteria bacterium]
MAKFKAGESGNRAGRPRGSRNSTTLLREALKDDLDEIIEKVKAAAREGSPIHQRMILERALPALKPVDEPVKLRLSGSLTERAQAVVKAVGAGRLTPDQAGRLMGLLADEARVIETDEIIERIAALEHQMKRALNEDA